MLRRRGILIAFSWLVGLAAYPTSYLLLVENGRFPAPDNSVFLYSDWALADRCCDFLYYPLYTVDRHARGVEKCRGILTSLAPKVPLSENEVGDHLDPARFRDNPVIRAIVEHAFARGHIRDGEICIFSEYIPGRGASRHFIGCMNGGVVEIFGTIVVDFSMDDLNKMRVSRAMIVDDEKAPGGATKRILDWDLSHGAEFQEFGPNDIDALVYACAVANGWFGTGDGHFFLDLRQRARFYVMKKAARDRAHALYAVVMKGTVNPVTLSVLEEPAG